MWGGAVDRFHSRWSGVSYVSYHPGPGSRKPGANLQASARGGPARRNGSTAVRGFETLVMSESIFGWSTAVLVLAGIATAWADPTAGHWLKAGVLAVGTFWLIRMVFKEYQRTHWLIAPLLGAAV